MDTKIPMEIVNSLTEIIQESAPLVVGEIMRQQVKELSQGIQCDQQASNYLRSLVIDLQDKLDVIPLQSISSVSLAPRDCSPQAGDGQSSGLRSPHANSSSREREIVRKGINRLEKQILQLICVFILETR